MIARARGADAERGSISVFVVGLAVALLVLAGLVIDGGRAINARAAASDDAEQAARVGANQIDETELRSHGVVKIEASRATHEANAFLSTKGYDDIQVVVAADAGTVTVRMTTTVATPLLGLLLDDSLEVSGSATARAAVGIDTEIDNAIGGAP